MENVWVTMLMITHKTSNHVDSFIWITPIVIATMVRPYLVRHAYAVTASLYREVSMISFFLGLGGVGCCLVAYSC